MDTYTELDLLQASFECALREYDAAVADMRATSTKQHGRQFIQAAKALRVARHNRDAVMREVRREHA
jgi:hypothetical protein